MLIAALLLSTAVQAPAAPRADYTLRLADPASRRVTVTIEFSNLPPGVSDLELTLPERFAFTTFAEAPVIDPWIVIVGDKPAEVARVRPFAWRIPCAADKPLAVIYNAPLDLRDWPEVDERGDYEMPIAAESYAMLACGAFVAAPSLAGFEHRVRFEVPSGWPVRCPWDEVEPGVYAPRSVLELQDALVAVGGWEVREFQSAGASATVAFAPSEARLAEEVGPLVGQIFATQIELFGGAPLPRYLFLFVPSRVRGFAGSAKHGSMVLSVGASTPATTVKSSAAHLVAHEFFHTWGASRYACPDELRFFNEGFTDYFAYETSRRIGALADARLEETIGEKLAAYESASAATDKSLVEAGGAEFFAGGAAYEQVYAGGLLLAALCEREFRSRSAAGKDAKTFLDFMRAFNNDPRWSREGAAPRLDDFFEQLGLALGAEFASAARKLVETPRADLSAALTGAGCRVERELVPLPLELRANFEGTRITSIDPKGAGARIGLRTGDKLLEVNGVKVAQPGDCQRAFAKPLDGQLRVNFERDGAKQQIDAAPPLAESIRFTWS